MKKLFKNIQTLLIVVLVLVILFLRNCKGEVIPPKGTVITKIETIWDTIITEVPIYVPQWKDRIEYDFQTDTLYQIDTVEVIGDYYASYYYEDTISNDSVTIRIKDTITQNKIKNRTLDYTILYPTVIITRDSIINDRGFYIGVGAGGTKSNLNYIGGEFLFKSRKRTAFGVGLGVNQNFQPTLMGKLYWKLGK